MSERIFLITSHYMGVLYIDELLRAGEEIVGVVAWPSGAGFYEGWYVPEAYDVRTKAFKHYLPLYEPDPNDLNSPEFVEVIRKAKPDYIISGYYGKIFKKRILTIPPKGCINIHPTGLPRFRGLSPYFTHMLFGDDRQYITMHWLDPGVDTGDIIAQASVEILPDETGFQVGHRVTEAGAQMFREYWPLVKEGKAPRRPQDPSIASNFNFSWEIAEINWKQSALQIYNLVRCLTKPLGGAWTMVGGYKMHVWKVRQVDPAEEIKMNDARPGEVLALTGKGLWVQCGQGQVQILEASLDDLPDTTPFELVSPIGGKMRLMLG
jgi:methionyl-tRNA formyltransferase